MNNKQQLSQLRRVRSQLRLREAEIARDWARGIPTPKAERAQLEVDMRANALQIQEVEFLLEREHEANKRGQELSKSGTQWSDQMLAALTYLLTGLGQRDLVNQAQKMVQEGWPKHQPTPESA